MKNSRIAAFGAASVLLASGLLLAGCGGDSSSAVPTDVPSDAAYAEINGQSGDSSITAVVGSPLVVKLACNGGTGYQWKMTPSGESVVNLTNSTGCEPDDKTTSAVGAAGHETWTYDVTTAGTEKLKFQSFPPGKDTPASTEVLTVVAS